MLVRIRQKKCSYFHPIHSLVQIQMYCFIMTLCCQFSHTKCGKYTFRDVFFISQTNLTLCLILQSEKDRIFSCLQDQRPYLGQGEGCTLTWTQIPLRHRQGQGLFNLYITHLHIGFYLWSESWHFFAFVPSHLD